MGRDTGQDHRVDVVPVQLMEQVRAPKRAIPVFDDLDGVPGIKSRQIVGLRRALEQESLIIIEHAQGSGRFVPFVDCPDIEYRHATAAGSRYKVVAVAKETFLAPFQPWVLEKCVLHIHQDQCSAIEIVCNCHHRHPA